MEMVEVLFQLGERSLLEAGGARMCRSAEDQEEKVHSVVGNQSALGAQSHSAGMAAVESQSPEVGREERCLREQACLKFPSETALLRPAR